MCVLSEGEERKKCGDFGGSGAKLAFLLNLTDLLYCIWGERGVPLGYQP